MPDIFVALRRRLAPMAFAAMLLIGGPCLAQEVAAQARASLPEAIRTAGTLHIATTFQWPPFMYQTDAGDLDGIDISIMRLLAARLGLKAEFTDITSLPVMLTGVSTGRFDAAIGQMGITQERLKIIDYVPYFRSGFALLVHKGNHDLNINNLCGHTLAVTQGSAQATLLDQLSNACVQAGKPAIGTMFYPEANLGQLAVANGRGEGFVNGSAAAVYNAKANPKLEVAPGLLDGHFSMVGIVVAKTSTALRTALLQALESAVADGSYMAVLKRFDVTDSALTLAQIRTPPAELAQ